jgi:hypothetical protein
MGSEKDEIDIDAAFRMSGTRTGMTMTGCAKQSGKAIPVA